MRILILAAMLFSLPAVAQDGVTRIFISPRVNVSAAELGREFDSHCPSVRISESQQRTDFSLEAVDNGSGVATASRTSSRYLTLTATAFIQRRRLPDRGGQRHLQVHSEQQIDQAEVKLFQTVLHISQSNVYLLGLVVSSWLYALQPTR